MKHECQFCQKECKAAQHDDDFELTTWFTCSICQSSFLKHLGGKLHLTRLYTQFRGQTYCLDLKHLSQETQILLLPKKVEDTVVIVLTLPYLIEGLNPDNISAKIQTYITFS